MIVMLLYTHRAMTSSEDQIFSNQNPQVHAHVLHPRLLMAMLQSSSRKSRLHHPNVQQWCLGWVLGYVIDHI